MMENQLEIIKSEKDNDLALVNTCKYRHIRQRNYGKVKWRYIHKLCIGNTVKWENTSIHWIDKLTTLHPISIVLL